MKLHNVRRPAKSCPHCRSGRVHRTHRRKALDHVLYALGAELRRCSDCRLRHAAFATFTLPSSQPQVLGRLWTRVFVMGSGFLVGLVFVWWVIRRITESSG
jgi:hypothetical protein